VIDRTEYVNAGLIRQGLIETVGDYCGPFYWSRAKMTDSTIYAAGISLRGWFWQAVVVKPRAK
jgi:hypothetical protein